MIKNKSINEFINYINKAYLKKNEKALDELQSYYSFGHYMDLAIAFHRLYGFEIQAVILNEQDKAWISHAWVKRPSGDYLDIMGIYSDTVELESFGGIKRTGLTEDDLYKYMNNSISLEEDIEKAKMLAKCILKNLSASKSPDIEKSF